MVRIYRHGLLSLVATLLLLSHISSHTLSPVSAEELASSSKSAAGSASGGGPEIEILRSLPYCQRGDQKPLLADIYRPYGRKGPFPAIMMVHGGAWFAGDKVQITSHARYAAGRGYVVMAINYRLAPRYKFPAQIEDCQSALEWLGQHADQYDIDPERIAAYGYSAGGHLVTLLAMTSARTDQAPRRTPPEGKTWPAFKAVVAGGTPCQFDWIPEESDALAYWLGGSRQELPEVYRQASPAGHVDPKDPPVFFFHGEKDQIVPLSSPQRMKKRLEEAGVHTAIHVVPGARHYQTFLAEEPRRAAVDFLDHMLQSTE